MQHLSQAPIVRVKLVREGARSSTPTTINSPAAAVAAVQYLAGLDREHLVVMHLDARNELLGMETAGIGTLTAALVSPREVFKAAILNNAASVILAHNHPSGVPEPSPEDRQATQRIAKAGDLLGIPLMDHIIVGGRAHYSFREHNALPRQASWEG